MCDIYNVFANYFIEFRLVRGLIPALEEAFIVNKVYCNSTCTTATLSSVSSHSRISSSVNVASKMRNT